MTATSHSTTSPASRCRRPLPFDPHEHQHLSHDNPRSIRQARAVAERVWAVQVAAMLLRRPAWSHETELLDDEPDDLNELRGNLSDLARVNRLLGGVRLTLRGLDQLTVSVGRGSSLRVLDVATGRGDIPAAILDWSERRDVRLRMVATDVSATILRIAVESGNRRICYAAADGSQLPFANKSFDVVACSLVLHHLEPARAIDLLRDMARVARKGVIVNDLDRCWLGYFGSLALGHLMTRNRMTRADAPLSVRRAYTPAHASMMMRQAGLSPVSVERALWHRYAIAARCTS